MVLIRVAKGREEKRRVANQRARLRDEVERTQRETREQKDAELRSNAEWQQIQRMTPSERAERAVDIMAKEVKDHNEQCGVTEVGKGTAWQVAGDSYEAARHYTAERANIADNKKNR